MSVESKASAAVAFINEQIAEHKPSHVFALFSGGHDSLTSTWIAAQCSHFNGAAHIDTGTGIRATREFVEETCKRQSWPLKVYAALQNKNGQGQPDPQDYKTLVRRYGFPGPAGHGMMYVRLKERCLRMLMREHKQHPRDRIMLISGCRSEESERRMGTTTPVSRAGCQVWVNPIHDWTKLECNLLLAAHELERNLVCDLIHRSGECNCGAFAKPGELEEMIYWFPEMKWIKDLEAEVAAEHPWRWGERPPKKTMPDCKVGVMCQGCGKQ